MLPPKNRLYAGVSIFSDQGGFTALVRLSSVVGQAVTRLHWHHQCVVWMIYSLQGLSLTHLNLPAGWCIGPRKRRVAGARYCAASGGLGSTFFVELGLLANLTVTGSVAPSGMVPFSCLMARSASIRWSKRMKPTPLEIPATHQTATCRTLNTVTKPTQCITPTVLLGL